MQLLVSAAGAADARAAIDGGAHIVDAKDPLAGPLGAVSLDTLRAIVRAVAGTRPVTAALGEARAHDSIHEAARVFTAAGARLVKLGFEGVADLGEARRIAGEAVTGARLAAAGVVLVAYADASAPAVSPFDLLGVASGSGAAGVLLDTADKSGPPLPDVVTMAWLAAWVTQARRAGLQVAVAGRLRACDLPLMERLGADIAGVRGAACEGGRNGRISAAKVADLRVACESVVQGIS